MSKLVSKFLTRPSSPAEEMMCLAKKWGAVPGSLTASPGVFSVPWVPQVLKRWSQMLIQDYAVPM